MLFTVCPARTHPVSTGGARFVLQQDNWNDFGFRTLYQLYDTHDVQPSLIGNVKILKLGQKDYDPVQISVGQVSDLGPDFCSLGQGLDYYERLASLPLDVRNDLLAALRDIVRHPEHSAPFESEQGWNTSLFRGIGDKTDFLSVARALLEKNYSSIATDGIGFSFHPAGWSAPVAFDFNGPVIGPLVLRSPFTAARSAPPLPSRLTALIGRNGSGKSTLLARLARVAFASGDERQLDQVLALGQIDPPGLGFSRIVAISYSAFDGFELPGLTKSERRQIASDVSTGTGRYIFCGLRDIVAELTESTQHDQELKDAERTDQTQLKTLGALADEFVRTLDHLRAVNDMDVLEDVVAPILADPSFGLTAADLQVLLSENPRDAFLSWSTGHKIVMHVAAAMTAHVQPRSLVLFDEPETHLHPPLLAAFMHTFRSLLKRRSAFAIVATHSPVVLQETLARHVHVIRREGALTEASPVDMETFGENVGAITHSVFDLTSEVTDFHRILDGLIARGLSLEQMEAGFPLGLSQQARAYVMIQLARKADSA